MDAWMSMELGFTFLYNKPGDGRAAASVNCKVGCKRQIYFTVSVHQLSAFKPPKLHYNNFPPCSLFFFAFVVLFALLSGGGLGIMLIPNKEIWVMKDLFPYLNVTIFVKFKTERQIFGFLDKKKHPEI